MFQLSYLNLIKVQFDTLIFGRFNYLKKNQGKNKNLENLIETKPNLRVLNYNGQNLKDRIEL